jgi:hypothetical protein
VKISSPQHRRLGLGLLAVLAASLALAATAFASPPSNDNFANAVALPAGLPQQIAGTNVEATTEAGEPEPTVAPGGASVWYRWTAAGPLRVTADTCTETNFDTVLAIYTGTAVNALTEVGANDDACGDGLQSRVSFEATAGTTYYIAVEGFSGDTGTFLLSLAGKIHAFTINSSIGSTDPIQTGRLNRNGSSSTCETPNQAPLFDSESHRYKTFPLVSLISEPACMEFLNSADAACEAGTSRVQLSVYSAFNPSEILGGLITAAGLSPPPTTNFSAALGAGSATTLVVNEVEKAETAAGCPSFTIEGATERPWANARPHVASGSTDVSGQSVVSQVALTAAPAIWGSPVKDAFQWQSCDATGNACANITGATGGTFTPKFAQVGHALRFIEIATDPTLGSSSTITSPPTGVVKPSHAIKLGKFKANKKKGTGLLTVLVPGAGKLTLTGKGVKKSKGSSKNEGKVVLKVRSSGKAKAALRDTGNASVKAKVKFVPTGGTAGTASRKLTLKKTTK